MCLTFHVCAMRARRRDPVEAHGHEVAGPQEQVGLKTNFEVAVGPTVMPA